MLFDVIQPFPTFCEAILLALRDLDAQPPRRVHGCQRFGPAGR
ncbi:hypothetical protein [Micromonospora coriariae]|nr:hypothetical protein [Micromonospora coriariae]